VDGTRGSGQNFGCIVAAGVLGLSLVIATAIVAYAMFAAGSSLRQALDRANPGNILSTNIAPSTPTIVVRPPAILQVRAISDLATAQQLQSTVVEVEKARVGDILYERLILLACGRVKAGIDLAQLRDQDVSSDGDVVTIRLPKAQLQDVYLIDDSAQKCTTKVYDRTNLILLPATRDLEQQAREQALSAIRETALESGILSDADRNARLTIERVLLQAGYRQVVFVDP
jgi:hypothetical protein